MNKKYEIIKNGTDDYTLKYKDKNFNFKTDLSAMNKIQGAVSTARKQLVQDYVEQKKSIKSLTIEEKINGKTYYDNSNKVAMEEIYIQEAQLKIYDEICQKNFGMGISELIMDIGLTEEEQEGFGVDFIQALIGKTPSRWEWI